MAAKLRHWKEKDGRYWARISIPVELKPFFNNRTQLTEPLGGDRRLAERNHPAAVARLLAQIECARQRHAATTFAQAETASSEAPDTTLRAITDDDTQRAVWDHYQRTLASDAEKRASMPTPAEIEAEFERTMQRIEAGESDPAKFGTYAPFNVQADYELLAGTRHHDERNRARRLAALRTMLISGETRLVDPAVKSFVEQQHLNVSPSSRDWRELALKIMRAEIEGLERTLELDQGVFDGQPKDPIIRQPTAKAKKPTPVSFRGLFADYIKAKQAEGTHLDGGANWPCCTNRVRDSLRESSMIAGWHEQLGPYEVQDHELVGLQ
ncbi:MAG: hypothetical protein AB7U46_16600 [Paenirhodobacter sp.]|uniref:hypothetical protein n=1 Tax=Paenirhodobacter sp. TaxID=1965326 RepID=UPI003D0A2953